MKVFQKVLLSFLLATAVFTGFAVAAYSGLFDLIDTRFYNQRVRSTTRALMEEAAGVTAQYSRALLRDIGSLAAERSVGAVFLINQSRTDTEERARLMGRLSESRPEIDYIRIIDNERGRLWFSSLDADIRSRSDVSIEYQPVEALDPPLFLPQTPEEERGVEWIPERGGVRVTAPIVDGFSIPRGVLVAWAGSSGLFSRLVDQGIIGPSQRVRLTPGGVLVFNAPRHFNREDLSHIDTAVARGDSVPILESAIGATFAVEVREESEFVPVGVMLIREAELHMDNGLRVILLAAVFVATFLVSYLILNIRQDPTIIVAERFRRFQQAVVRDYLREGRAVEPELWKKELDGRRERIDNELQRGLGRVNEESRRRLEQEMSRNWDELYHLFGTRGDAQRAELEPVSLKQIEAIIERTLSRYGRLSASSTTHPESDVASQPARRHRSDELEEIEDAEPVDELEEVGDVEPVDDPEEIPDAEPIDELEEIKDAEPVDELEEVGDVEPVDDPEEMPDAEPIDELEEIEDAEPVDESEEVGDVEPVDDPEEMPDAEPIDELEEIEDAEPVDESEEVGDGKPVDGPEEMPDAEPIDELEEIEDAEPVDELEEVGDVEPVDDPEEIPDAEPIDELEGIEDAEPVDELEEFIETDEGRVHDEVQVGRPDETGGLDEFEGTADLELAAELADAPGDIAPTRFFDVVEEMVEAEPIDELEEVVDGELDEAVAVDDVSAEIADAESDDEAYEAGPVDEPQETEYGEDGSGGTLAIGIVEGIDEEPFLGEIVVEEEIGPLVPEADWLAGYAVRDEPDTVRSDADLSPDGAEGATASRTQDWLPVSTTPPELSEDERLIPEPAGDRAALDFAPSSPLEEAAQTDDASMVDPDEATFGLPKIVDVDDPEELEALEEIAESDEPGSGALEPVEELEPVDVEDLSPVRGTVASEELIEELDEVQFDSAEALPIEEVGEGAPSFVSAFSSFGGASSIRDSLPSSTDGPAPTVPIRKETLPDEIVVRGIENTETHHIMEIEDFFASAGRRHSVFEERDGLIQIRAAAYFAEYRDIDQRVQLLAEQILLHHDLSSIDDVLKTAFDDLDFDDIFDDAESEQSSADHQDTALRIVSGGFEFPIRVDSGNVGVRQVYRELVQITRRWNARVALVLDELADGRMQGSFGIGLSEECDSSLSFEPDCDLVRNVVAFRRVALLKRPLSFFRDFADTCHASKLVSVNSWLLLPLRDTGARRYLMVGFSRPFDSLMDLTMRYDIVPRAV